MYVVVYLVLFLTCRMHTAKQAGGFLSLNHKYELMYVCNTFSYKGKEINAIVGGGKRGYSFVLGREYPGM